ncbi:MAG: hypothetical protein ACXV5I_07795 [Halobacteriota archaeon]
MSRSLVGIILAALVIGAVVSGVLTSMTTSQGQSSQGQTFTKAQVDLKTDMRKLWEDHVTWTRIFIVETAANISNNLTVDRLLKNQEDIGNAIKPYYGDAAGNQLTALLKEHIATAGDVVNAAKAENNTALADANTRWFANADKIAAFLGTANPSYWPEPEMKSMLYDHLNLTTAEAVARLHGDYAGDIQAYDKVVNQAMTMADGLSAGIIGQFPAQFGQTAVSPTTPTSPTTQCPSSVQCSTAITQCPSSVQCSTAICPIQCPS